MRDKRKAFLVPVAAASAAVGFVLGRVIRARRLVNGNFKWMSPAERKLVLRLMGTGQKHLFRSWPAPGVRNAEKRQLLRVMADDASTKQDVEKARLAVLQPPIAMKRPKELLMHNDLRTDDYYWLRDDERKDPDVIEHIKAENAHTAAVMADTEDLQEKLYKEMRGRIQEEDTSVPVRHHGFYYYSRTEEGAQYPIICRRAVPQGAGTPSEADAMDASVPEEVLLDENKRKEQLHASFYMVGDWDPSPNHQLLAWSEDTVGGEKYTLHVKDLHSGKEVTEPVPMTSGDLMWANDNATVFYIVKDELDRPYKVLRHRIGTPSSCDVVVYEESDDSFYVGVGRSRSDQMLFIHAGSAVTSETRFLSADTPEGEWQVLQARENDVEYDAAHHPGCRDQGATSTSTSGTGVFFITRRDKDTPNSDLRIASVSDPTNQRVLLPHREDVKLAGVSVSKEFLVIWERANALKRAVVHRLPASWDADSLSLAEGQELVFDEPAYSLSGGDSGDFESTILRLSYTSLTTPPSVMDHNMSNGARAVKKVQPVKGGYDKSAYRTERMWATSHDGTKVPLSVVYRKDLAKLDGSDPMLLSGYGSYESSYDAAFSTQRLSLLDRGFVYGIAHIRGGGDMGRRWYENGKYLHKKNTFDDFVAVAEHLIQRKYTSAQKLCIEGRSAGGLLMGAVVNMRPDLFNAALMGVPFVDALTTMLDDTIPLTIIEWEEWGNPKDPEFYHYMKSYSPVDNVKRQRYPHILATGGLHDPRVGFWEPAKFVAKLREMKTDDNMLLLKMDMGAGHFSVTGRFDRLKEVALEYAFLLKAQGMLDTSVQPATGDGTIGQGADNGSAPASAASKL